MLRLIFIEYVKRFTRPSEQLLTGDNTNITCDNGEKFCYATQITADNFKLLADTSEKTTDEGNTVCNTIGITCDKTII